jgi:hypothetical protein
MSEVSKADGMKEVNGGRRTVDGEAALRSERRTVVWTAKGDVDHERA